MATRKDKYIGWVFYMKIKFEVELDTDSADDLEKIVELIESLQELKEHLTGGPNNG